MLKLCLPVAPFLWIFLQGKVLEAFKSICSKINTFYTDSVLNVKSMLTSFLAEVFGGEDVSEPRTGPFGPLAVLAMFAIFVWLMVILLSSTIASTSASGFRFDAVCVVAFSCFVFGALQ